MQYFAKRDFDDLSLAGEYNEKGTTAWYDDTENVEIFVGDKAVSIDRNNKIVVSEQGRVSFCIYNALYLLASINCSYLQYDACTSAVSCLLQRRRLCHC
jgi:hypothetical protein